MRVFRSLKVGGWDIVWSKVRRKRMFGGIKSFRFDNARFRPDLHRVNVDWQLGL